MAPAAAVVGVVIAVAAVLPAPAYRWQEEQKARTEIREFLADERRIAHAGGGATAERSAAFVFAKHSKRYAARPNMRRSAGTSYQTRSLN